jgi:mRNA interferase MazF
VFQVNFDPVVGSEIRKTRPAVIILNSCNRYGGRVVVLPIISNVESLYPGEAIVELKGKHGRSLGDQIRPIDKSRLKARAGRLTAEEMSRVEPMASAALGADIRRE